MKLVLFASLVAVAVGAPQPMGCVPNHMARKGDVSACAGPIAPQPVIAAPAVSSSNPSPLVQIILNINQAATGVAEVPEVAPTPVQVVETAPIPVDPVQVVEVAPEPVQVVDSAPVPSEPISVGDPILPIPVVPLPGDFN